MRLNYKKLGCFIREIDTRNYDGALGEDNLYGISVTKEFIISHANLVGVSFNGYKVVSPKQFAYIPDTSRRGDKIAISLNQFGESIIVSSICSVFEIIDENQLLPEYLMLWFMRPEFDRYARFMSNGSAREVFDWESMCGVEIPVPSIEQQYRIVHDYQVLKNRIALLQSINERLVTLSKSVFTSIFLSDTLRDSVKLSDLCEITSGKRVPKELDFSVSKTNHPYIRVRDINDADYVCLTDSFEYIDDETFSYISKYTVVENDIIISSVGTVGLIGRIHKSLNQANLTENCFRIRCFNNEYVEYVFYALLCYKDSRQLENIIDGSVQAKLPLEKFRNLFFSLPTDEELLRFNSIVKPISRLIDNNNSELIHLAHALDYSKARIVEGE